MTDPQNREPAREPNALERLLVSRQWAGEVEGMLELFETAAVIDSGDGTPKRGLEDIRALYLQQAKSGRKFDVGVQQPAIVSGDLALTSTRLPDGSVTAEVARRQSNGTWLWVIDQYSIA